MAQLGQNPVANTIQNDQDDRQSVIAQSRLIFAVAGCYHRCSLWSKACIRPAASRPCSIGRAARGTSDCHSEPALMHARISVLERRVGAGSMSTSTCKPLARNGSPLVAQHAL